MWKVDTFVQNNEFYAKHLELPDNKRGQPPVLILLSIT
jgi:hypothetical protein